MRKAIIAFLLMAVFTLVKAQSVRFKMHFMPNRTYQSTMQVNTSTTMNVSGDSVSMQKIKAKGVKLPILITADINTDVTIIRRY
jgi:hypothetical protein